MTSDRVQSVRNGWTNALRAEVLRAADRDSGTPELRRELPKIAAVGVWISSYADADGGGAYPSRETLARLAGCSPETVTRAVRVLAAVGMLRRKRRPNSSAVYQLLMPLGRPDWAKHLHLFTDTRQRRAHAKKQREAAESKPGEQARTASMDAVRTASAPGVPDSVHGRSPEGADSVHGRPRTASMDAFRTASMDAPTSSFPTCGRDPLPDHEMADAEPQPQDARDLAPENDDSPLADEEDQPPLRGLPSPPLGSRARRAAAPRQSPLLASVPTDYEQLRRDADADPGLVRRAVAELGSREATTIYGWRRVASVLNHPDDQTGTDGT